MMRLGEAIRLGAMLRPQAHGYIRGQKSFWGIKYGKESSCALGAAIEAAGIIIEESAPGPGLPIRGSGKATHSISVPYEWLIILAHHLQCPGCSLYGPVSSIIPHLNDVHRWTRERIADWVDSIDPTPKENELKTDSIEQTIIQKTF